MSTPPLQHAKVLRMKEVWKRLGISRSKGYELMRKDPLFPKRVTLGARAMGVLEHHLDAYIESKLAAA
ncbi:AlpA family transcriptional regulator [Variovorax sp.]|jgi:prophage regulatory protein|uniref:AlpA family phage regulatory protein n=1 Tax=Brugia timori TaxID=42155 RepID=A0A0R3Q5B0_9BILA|nr:AlpA family phage regulatory protein [Variovorax sp.]MBS75194.1 hypothetical protein [Variovorax sp.]VDO08759.1 unnamed protein product [Brugia timori]